MRAPVTKVATGLLSLVAFSTTASAQSAPATLSSTDATNNRTTPVIVETAAIDVDGRLDVAARQQVEAHFGKGLSWFEPAQPLPEVSAALRQALRTTPCSDALASAEALETKLAAALVVVPESRATVIDLLTLTLSCAHQAGKTSVAFATAHRLRQLSDGSITASVADLLAQYPTVDATNEPLITITVAAPANVELFVDYLPAASSGVLHLTPGPHVVAARSGQSAAAVHILAATATTIALQPLPQTYRTDGVANAIASWHHLGYSEREAVVAKVAIRAGADAVLVFHNRASVLWRRAALGRWATFGDNKVRTAPELRSLLVPLTATPTPNQFGFRRDPKSSQPSKAGKGADRTPWWVWASVGGAAAMLGGVVWATAGSDDTAVTVRWP
jgi:hypothetical protein